MIASLRKEIMEQWRTSRMVVCAVVLVAFGMLSPVLAKLTPEMFKLIPGAEQIASIIPTPTVVDAVAQYIKNISQFMLLLAVFLSMGAVAQEKERGTAAMMLVKPVSRAAFLFSKFAALAVTLTAGLVLAALFDYYYTVFLFEALNAGAFLLLNAFLLLYALVIVAITLLFSTLVRSQAAAAGLGVGALFLLAIIGAIPGLEKYTPAGLVTWGSSLFTAQVTPYWTSLWVSLGLLAAALLAAWLIFEKQEM